MRGHQTPSDAIRRHQTPSDAIRRHQSQSEALRSDHLRASGGGAEEGDERREPLRVDHRRLRGRAAREREEERDQRRRSSGGHQEVITRLSGGHQQVISRPSGSHQAAIGKSSPGHQQAIRWPSSGAPVGRRHLVGMVGSGELREHRRGGLGRLERVARRAWAGGAQQRHERRDAARAYNGALVVGRVGELRGKGWGGNQAVIRR